MKPSLQEAFEAFDRQNPGVYVLFKRFAFEAIRAGREHIGVAAIYERMRWFTAVETSGDGFKLNNNHRAFYARKFMAEHPEHRGFFETRSSPGSVPVRRVEKARAVKTAPRKPRRKAREVAVQGSLFG